jgi:riboflavin kinase/FMN adenylyltransferase
MLTTIDFTNKRNNGVGAVLLLGGFDGLHVGHKQLLARAKSFGLPVGVMSIFGGKSGESLFSQDERLDIFRRVGADFAFALPFEKIKNLSATEFIEILQKEYAPKAFVCGEDFRFGYQAQGTPQTLKALGQVCVEVHEIVMQDGEKVGATMIKRLLLQGEIEKANAALGENFFLFGEVFKDREIGKTLGFPTANIRYPKEKFPLKQGVHQTRFWVDGKAYDGLTNYGARPTFNDVAVWTETYLDGFSGDLYGRTLKVEFKRLLREIEKFPNAEALKAQLERDIRRIREND